MRALASGISIWAACGVKDQFVVVPPWLYISTLLPRLAFRLLFFALLAKFLGGDEFLSYALIGNAVASAGMSALVATVQTMAEELRGGTLGLLRSTPTHPLWVIAAWGSGRVVLGLLESLLSLGAAAVILGLRLDITSLWVIPVQLINVLSVYGLGLMLAAVCYRFQGSMLISNSALFTLSAICGINFPIAAVPEALQPLSWSLPLSHGLLAVRALLSRSDLAMAPWWALQELGIAITYLAMGVAFYNYHLAVARSRGMYY